MRTAKHWLDEVILGLSIFLILAGCAHVAAGLYPPTLYSPRGAEHEVVAYFPDGSYQYGTCFAISPSEALTASHVVARIGANGVETPDFIEIDGHGADIWKYDPHDSAPALLHDMKGFAVYTPTGTAMSGPGNVSSLLGDAGGVISTYTQAYGGFGGGEVVQIIGEIDVGAVAGESGSPIMQAGAAVGVLIGVRGGVTVFEAPTP